MSGVSDQPRRLRVLVVVLFTLLVVNRACRPWAEKSDPDVSRHGPISLVLVGLFGDYRDGVP
jgi:hypothetical protein